MCRFVKRRGPYSAAMKIPPLKRGIEQAWLLVSPLPFPLNFISVHAWCTVSDRHNATYRWEVWHRKLPAERRWGYIHRNLFAPFRGIGLTPLTRSRCWQASPLCYWEGECARRLSRILAESARTYPHFDRYLYWPGPNSNTYVQWILDRLPGKTVRLPERAIGSRFFIE